LRVLWFVNIPLPAVTERHGAPPIHHGSWLDQLETAVRGCPDTALGIAAAGQDSQESFESAGVAYFGLGSERERYGYQRVARRWRRLLQADRDLRACERIVDAFRPDLIHVHGTEKQFGLLASRCPVPVVISIQGVLSVYELLGTRGRDTSLLLSASPSLFARGTGALLDHVELKRRAARERLMIQRCRYFIGRTRFDADVIHVLNPRAEYNHCDELLRPEFHESTWDELRAEPCTVYSTAGGYARKGLGTLLRAAALLREGPLPDVRLRLAGAPDAASEDGRAAGREIRRLGLSHCVTSAGALGPEGVVRELLRASVFALPTHADNSPNSLAEAMMVGTPCVASAAGGIPTLARDGVEALLVQDGDPYALAGAVLRLFDDRELARRLSRNARAAALVRHDPERVRDTLMEIYRHILDDSGPSAS